MESSGPILSLYRNYRKSVLAVVGLFSLLCITLLVARLSYLSPIDTTDNEQNLIIAPGSSLNSVIDQLQSSGVGVNGTLIKLVARLTGVENAIQAGEYELTPGMNNADLLAKIVSGDVVQHRVTFIEGWTINQALEALASHSAITQTLNEVSQEALTELLELAVPTAEGMIHPETYFFSRGTTDLEILRRARRRQQNILEDLWESRLGALPLESSYEALILASIIEKESGLASEKNQIAGVFIRRLEQNMRLQSDPTVIYGLGSRYNGDITREHLQEVTAYNTYRISGLPPTPIALPGLESVRASLNPADGDYLYFVATGDGGHQFSATLEEHNAAVSRYQRAGNQSEEDSN